MGETDGFKMALELSKQQLQKDEIIRNSKREQAPRHQQNFQDMMMDTAGFQKFLEASQKEDERKKEEKNLMADTAGFHKILEMSKKEEEDRK